MCFIWKIINCNSFTTAAIKTDGTLWLWGLNNQGHLGIDSTANRSSPVQTVAGGTNWKSIGGGAQNVVAIRDDSSDIL